MSKQVSIMLLESRVNGSYLQSVDPWDYAFWNGVKCGYPLCCIMWFCDVQTNGGLQKDSLYERVFREAYEEQNHCQGSKLNYAPCPDCLARLSNK